METSCSTTAALLLAFCVFVQSHSNRPVPGCCPRVFNTLLPAKSCHHDGSCPQGEKCCTYDSRSVCAPVSRPPKCPFQEERVGICIQECCGDWDCDRGTCCFNGCGHVCMSQRPGPGPGPGPRPRPRPRPRPEKPGFCGNPWTRHHCRGHCYHDYNCPGHLKCCQSRCGLSCMKPTYHWPIVY